MLRHDTGKTCPELVEGCLYYYQEKNIAKTFAIISRKGLTLKGTVVNLAGDQTIKMAVLFHIFFLTGIDKHRDWWYNAGKHRINGGYYYADTSVHADKAICGG
jgi:hypothetical protein